MYCINNLLGFQVPLILVFTHIDCVHYVFVVIHFFLFKARVFLLHPTFPSFTGTSISFRIERRVTHSGGESTTETCNRRMKQKPLVFKKKKVIVVIVIVTVTYINPHRPTCSTCALMPSTEQDGVLGNTPRLQ